MKILFGAILLAMTYPVAAQHLAEGEVRNIDRKVKTVTLKHGPIQSLDMPAMTMVFQVNDPALLNKVKPGDKVRFQAEMVGGEATITKIERARRPVR